jgi:hypothetical protein
MKLMVMPVGRSLVFSGSQSGKKYFVLWSHSVRNVEIQRQERGRPISIPRGRVSQRSKKMKRPDFQCDPAAPQTGMLLVPEPANPSLRARGLRILTERFSAATRAQSHAARNAVLASPKSAGAPPRRSARWPNDGKGCVNIRWFSSFDGVWTFFLLELRKSG